MDDKETQRVREFQEAYKEDFGEELTEGEATAIFMRLAQLYLHLSRPLPSDTPGTNEEAVKD